MEATELVEQLRALLTAGYTFDQVAAELGRPRSTLWSIAKRHKIRRRRRGLTAEQARIVRRELSRGNNSPDTIARLARCHRSTVYRYARPVDNDGRTPQRVRANWRCPQCRALINLDRCLLCKIARPVDAH